MEKFGTMFLSSLIVLKLLLEKIIFNFFEGKKDWKENEEEEKKIIIMKIY